MHEETSPLSQTFVLRLWSEELEGGRVEWRGRLHHIASGEILYFRDWPTLFEGLLKLTALFDRARRPEDGDRSIQIDSRKENS